MATDRRTLLKSLAAAATLTVASPRSEAAEARKAAPDAVGLLYDATRCIGCKVCVAACKQAQKLDADVDGYGGGLYDAPEGLNEFTKNVILLAKSGNETSFVKKQCMHCVDPACVNACMLGSLHKGQYGIVSWDADRCVGCRYCEVACPFNVPKFEWSKRAPKIVKCELCRDRLAEGKIPACAESCPRQAVIYGKREELLLDAHNRIKANPGKYYEDRVYGEKELGGTQVLYLSHVPFKDLGFQFEHAESVPSVQRTAQRWIYGGVMAPVALLLGAVTFRNRKAVGGQHDETASKESR